MVSERMCIFCLGLARENYLPTNNTKLNEYINQLCQLSFLSPCFQSSALNTQDENVICESCSTYLEKSYILVTISRKTMATVSGFLECLPCKMAKMEWLPVFKDLPTTDTSCFICFKVVNRSTALSFDVNSSNVLPYNLVKKMLEVCTISMPSQIIDPVMCPRCWETLQEVFTFKRCCDETESKVKEECQDNIESSPEFTSSESYPKNIDSYCKTEIDCGEFKVDIKEEPLLCPKIEYDFEEVSYAAGSMETAENIYSHEKKFDPNLTETSHKSKEDETSKIQLKKSRRRRKEKRKPWSLNETNLIKKHFKTYLNRARYPSHSELLSFSKEHLGMSRTAAQIKTKINKLKYKYVNDLQVYLEHRIEEIRSSNKEESDLGSTSNSKSLFERISTFVCPYCEFITKSDYLVYIHMLAHKRGIMCKDCDSQTPVNVNSCIHLKQKRKRTSQDVTTENVISINSEKQNLSETLPESVSPSRTLRKVYKNCAYCEYKSYNKIQYENHVRTHLNEMLSISKNRRRRSQEGVKESEKISINKMKHSLSTKLQTVYKSCERCTFVAYSLAQYDKHIQKDHTVIEKGNKRDIKLKAQEGIIQSNSTINRKPTVDSQDEFQKEKNENTSEPLSELTKKIKCCEICNYQTCSALRYKTHLKSKHNVMESDLRSPETKLKINKKRRIESHEEINMPETPVETNLKETSSNLPGAAKDQYDQVATNNVPCSSSKNALQYINRHQEINLKSLLEHTESLKSPYGIKPTNSFDLNNSNEINLKSLLESSVSFKSPYDIKRTSQFGINDSNAEHPKHTLESETENKSVKPQETAKAKNKSDINNDNNTIISNEKGHFILKTPYAELGCKTNNTKDNVKNRKYLDKLRKILMSYNTQKQRRLRTLMCPCNLTFKFKTKTQLLSHLAKHTPIFEHSYCKQPELLETLPQDQTPSYVTKNTECMLKIPKEVEPPTDSQNILKLISNECLIDTIIDEEYLPYDHVDIDSPELILANNSGEDTSQNINGVTNRCDVETAQTTDVVHTYKSKLPADQDVQINVEINFDNETFIDLSSDEHSSEDPYTISSMKSMKPITDLRDKCDISSEQKNVTLTQDLSAMNNSSTESNPHSTFASTGSALSKESSSTLITAEVHGNSLGMINNIYTDTRMDDVLKSGIKEIGTQPFNQKNGGTRFSDMGNVSSSKILHDCLIVNVDDLELEENEMLKDPDNTESNGHSTLASTESAVSKECTVVSSSGQKLITTEVQGNSLEIINDTIKDNTTDEVSKSGIHETVNQHFNTKNGGTRFSDMGNVSSCQMLNNCLIMNIYGFELGQFNEPSPETMVISMDGSQLNADVLMNINNSPCSGEEVAMNIVNAGCTIEGSNSMESGVTDTVPSDDVQSPSPSCNDMGDDGGDMSGDELIEDAANECGAYLVDNDGYLHTEPNEEPNSGAASINNSKGEASSRHKSSTYFVDSGDGLRESTSGKEKANMTVDDNSDSDDVIFDGEGEKLDEGRETFKCNQCNFSSCNKMKVDRHIESHKPKILKKVYCTRCSYSTSDFNLLPEHLKTHETLVTNTDNNSNRSIAQHDDTLLVIPENEEETPERESETAVLYDTNNLSEDQLLLIKRDDKNPVTRSESPVLYDITESYDDQFDSPLNEDCFEPAEEDQLHSPSNEECLEPVEEDEPDSPSNEECLESVEEDEQNSPSNDERLEPVEEDQQDSPSNEECLEPEAEDGEEELLNDGLEPSTYLSEDMGNCLNANDVPDGEQSPTSDFFMDFKIENVFSLNSIEDSPVETNTSQIIIETPSVCQNSPDLTNNVTDEFVRENHTYDVTNNRTNHVTGGDMNVVTNNVTDDVTNDGTDDRTNVGRDSVNVEEATVTNVGTDDITNVGTDHATDEVANVANVGTHSKVSNDGSKSLTNINTDKDDKTDDLTNTNDANDVRDNVTTSGINDKTVNEMDNTTCDMIDHVIPQSGIKPSAAQSSTLNLENHDESEVTKENTTRLKRLVCKKSCKDISVFSKLASDLVSICNFCNTGFTSETQKNEHIQTEHFDSSQPYKCSLCIDKQTFIKEKYVEHMRSKHKGVLFKCFFCGLTFKNVGFLQRHVLRHRRVFPNFCDTCIKINFEHDANGVFLE